MSQYFQNRVNRTLDNLVRENIRLFHLNVPSFQFFGCAGFGACIVWMLLLANFQALPLRVALIIAAGVGGAFSSLSMLTKIITGGERLVYYHHMIAGLGITLLLLHTLDQPVLPYLDITILSVGIFLACCRVGCLMVGCCHGRPYHWGVCYRAEHAAAGFAPYYTGVRLFPIQAVESAWVFCIAVAGSVLLLDGRPPGTALAWYIITYASGRFVFEFLRGDPQRGYFGGFSEAQWISLFLMVFVGVVEIAGALPFYAWHLAATACIALTMIAIASHHHFRPSPHYRLLQPRHISEFASILARIDDNARAGTQTANAARRGHVLVGTTSLGIQLSAGTLHGSDGCLQHYTCSCAGTPLNRQAAEILVSLLRQLRHRSSMIDIIERKAGIFHLVVHPTEDAI